jgi:hypothetical protein
MTLPSVAGGVVTQEVGYIDAAPDTVAPWLRDGLGDRWTTRTVEWHSLAEAVADLAPSPLRTRQAAIPADGWTLMLTNGPLGTDIGMVPSNVPCQGIGRDRVDIGVWRSARRQAGVAV